MKVRLQSANKIVELNNSDFLAAGGEGKIFVKGTTAYKIYEDQSKMILPGKFTELSVLTDQNIIKPEDVLFDMKDRRVGFTMRYIKNTYTLCQLFTKAFRLRNAIKPEDMLDLVQQMQKTINHIHSNNILIVDLNEFNFLVDDKFKDVYFIDVNSYQTKSYPAMAIMDSIRDRQAKKFSELTDWFSFAIISFQMFIGIHPFKGKHPKYDFDDRMLKNISVMNKEVTFPAAACQPFSVIPDSWMQWYKAVFDDGKRLPPPRDFVAGIIHVLAPVIKTVQGKVLAITKVREFDTPIKAYYHSYGYEVFVTEDKVILDKTEFATKNQVNVGFTKSNMPVLAWLEGKSVKLHNLLHNKEIPFICNGDKIMDFDGRIYVQNGMNIIEIQFTEMPGKIIASPHIVANVLEQSTKFYDGVIIQNLFDAYYISIFPESKQCQQIAIRELDGQKVIDAKYENKVLMVVSVDKAGHYNRFTFTFKDWKNYEYIEKKNVTYMGLNFTVLDNGICIHVDEDENIQIFHNDRLQAAKLVKDDVIDNDMLLYHKGATTLFTKDKAIYSMTMKKP